MARVAIASCQDPSGDAEDQALLDAALDALGIAHELLAWDSGADFDAFDLTVVRSTWDYAGRREEFLAWASSVERLENPAEVLRFSTDKRYLARLEAAGVAIVPTAFLEDASELVVPDAERFVVKPSVGAGSIGARRFDASEREAAVAHAASLIARGSAALVQPYLELVDEADETGVVVIDGEASHAIAKGPLLGKDELDRSGLFLAESISPRSASSEELDLARAALEVAGDLLGLDEPLLYARVDLLPTAEGPVVIELELAEPSLFLAECEGSAELLAAAISRRI